MTKKHFYVTSPIYYVNAKPHLGTLYSTLLCDALARWHKVLGEETFFLTGTDEHGQKIQERAHQVGVEPKKFVDSMIPAFKEAWELFAFDYDKFIRTTDEYHQKAVCEWINQLLAQGDIYKSTYVGWYCVPCETFVTVNTETAKNVAGEPLCPSCNRGLKQLEEESYFFKLSAYQDRLLAFYEQNPDFITPRERMHEVVAFVKAGLKDLSISRKTVSWGIPFPQDPSHTVYVWGDALNNYISAIGFGGNADEKRNFDQWWPANVHVMAKDIVRFHAVYWPAFLMATGLALPRKLLVHGYILTDGQKMSKSLGNVVDPAELARIYGVEQVRYYLLKQMAITHDGNFSTNELIDVVNADLANNLGNLLNRALTLAAKYNVNTCRADALDEKQQALQLACKETAARYREALDNGMFHVALAEVCKLLSQANAYFHAAQPWVVAKTDMVAFTSVIATTCNVLMHSALLLWPVMPKKMEQLLAMLGIGFDSCAGYEDILQQASWQTHFTLTSNPIVLFARIEQTATVESAPVAVPTTKESCMETQAITIDDFAKVELLVGTIEVCEPVSGSNKLYRLEVNFGEHGKRQILSGVAQHFTCEELIGKQAIAVANLQPRKMMGMESHGMLLMAKDENGLRLATVAGSVANGTRLS